MNTINPQAAPSGVQHDQRRGIERTDSSEYSPKAEPKATVKQTDQVQDSKDSKQLEVAVARLNDYVQSVERDLRFSLDRESGQAVISVFDRKTSELIRQIPPEITLDLAQQLNSDEPLLLFSAQV